MAVPLGASSFSVWCISVMAMSYWSCWFINAANRWFISKAGDEIELDKFNAIFYRRAIESYEKNKYRIDGDNVYINGQLANTYTFKMNYYWLMGDNRHNSLDSRMWGYVPEDHIVGKAAFIWFSKDNEAGHEGVRWNRIFQSAHWWSSSSPSLFWKYCLLFDLQ